MKRSCWLKPYSGVATYSSKCKSSKSSYPGPVLILSMPFLLRLQILKVLLLTSSLVGRHLLLPTIRNSIARAAPVLLSVSWNNLLTVTWNYLLAISRCSLLQRIVIVSRCAITVWRCGRPVFTVMAMAMVRHDDSRKP